MKKATSIILMIAMLMSIVPFSVFATENTSIGETDRQIGNDTECNRYASLSDEEKAEVEFHDKLANAETEEEKDAIIDEYYQTTEILKPDKNSINSEEYFDDGILRYYIKSDGKEVSVYEPCDKNIEQVSIPATVSHDDKIYPVTSIAWNAFSGCTSLTSIEIPNSVTNILGYAFKECTNLTYVHLPKNLNEFTRYGNFSGCDKLKTAGPVGGNYNIQFDWTEKIPEEIFSGSEIIQVDIPDTITNIGNSAFCSCENLTEVAIPDSVTVIANSAFAGCLNMKSISIGNKVTAIESNAFSDCTSLRSVNVPDSVTSIGSKAFDYCTSLQSVNIGSGVTTIDYGAFKDCGRLISVIIPDSVIEIEGYVSYNHTCGIFEGCYSLKTAGPIGGDYNIQFGWTDRIPGETFLSSEISQIKLPDTITTIENSTFYYCENLTSANIPDSVTSIDNWAFIGCKSMTSVNIPNSVTYIGSRAFCVCSSLQSIDIPNSVTSIENETFDNCTSLTSATIGNSVEYIGKEAFLWCKSLTSVTIGNSVTNIGSGAFACCTSLQSVNVPDSVTSIGSEAFAGCKSLTSIDIPNSVTSIGNEAFCGCLNLKSVVIPDGVTTINTLAFGFYYNNGELKKVDGFTIYGYKGSEAERYANDNGFKFFGINSESYLPSKHGWGFSNYTANISEDLFYRVFDRNDASSQVLYERVKYCKGVCAGMSATSILTYTNEIPINYFSKYFVKSYASEFSFWDLMTSHSSELDATLNEFIQSQQIYRGSKSASYEAVKNANKVDAILYKVINFQETHTNPIILEINDGQGNHHAVVPYKIEVKGLQDVREIYVYDPNYPKGNNNHITINLKNSGEIESWEYGEYTSENEGAYITYRENPHNVLDKYNNTLQSNSEDTNDILCASSSNDYQIEDSFGNIVHYQSGNYENLLSSDVIPVQITSGVTSTASMFYLESGNSIKMTNNEDSDMEATFADKNTIVDMETDGQSSVGVATTDSTYDIEVTPSTENSINNIKVNNTKQDTTFEFEGTSDTSVQVTSSQDTVETTISGYDNLTTDITYDGRKLENLEVSTDDKSIKIEEKDEGGIKVEKDIKGDGTYDEIIIETESNPKLESMSLISSPKRTKFEKNEDLDLSGLLIKAIYADTTIKELGEEDCTINGYDKTKLGEQEITIQYQDMSVALTVEVIDNPEWSINTQTKTISKLSEKTTVASIQEYYAELGREVQILNKEWQTPKYIGTGCLFVLDDVNYSVVVTGDVTGDGVINLTDAFGILDHINGVKKLTGEYEKAGLIISSKTISISDAFAVIDHINGTKKIEPKV